MPIYEYVCFDCGNRFELVRPMRDADAPIPCMQCESEHTSRQLAVVFASHGVRESAGSGSYASGNGGGCAGCGGGSCSSCRH